MERRSYILKSFHFTLLSILGLLWDTRPNNHNCSFNGVIFKRQTIIPDRYVNNQGTYTVRLHTKEFEAVSWLQMIYLTSLDKVSPHSTSDKSLQIEIRKPYSLFMIVSNGAMQNSDLDTLYLAYIRHYAIPVIIY